MQLLSFSMHTNTSNVLTCGSLPGVREEGGVVLDLVGEDGGAVVAPGLPHHTCVLAVALDPEQLGRVRHVLHDQGGGLPILVQLSQCLKQVCLSGSSFMDHSHDPDLTSVAARVELRGLGDGQAVVVGLDEPRLGVEVDPPAVLEPVDLQVQVGVGHGVATEGGGVPRLHLVRLRALKYHHRLEQKL